MITQKTWLIVIIWLLGVGCSQPVNFPAGRWIDLSYDLSAQTITWPTSEPFRLDTVAAGRTGNGYYYAAFNFCGSEHGGTHLDAPIHFAENRKTVDQIPLTQLIAPAVKIDISGRATANRDYQINVRDLLDWEAQHGRIPDSSIVLLYTGFGKYWPDPTKYLGTSKRGAAGVAALHFPGLAPAAAMWLLQNRRIKAVGIDTASIDFGQSQTYGTHVALMEQNIPAFENVANLDQVPTVGAQVIALPLKIKGGSGGPLRIIAFIPEGAGVK